MIRWRQGMKYILIVDDEQLIRYSLSAAFQDKETEIIARPDGKGALKAIGDWRFDFCFLDIQLPDTSGINILKMMRQLAPRTKVVMMTGGAVDDSTMSLIRENAFLFLRKPFDLFRVKRVLNAVSREDENVYRELSALEEWLEIERRQHKRQVVATPIYYVTAPSGEQEKERPAFSADLLDISDAGTRIRTACRLEPGSRIRFKDSVNNASGIVRWTSVEENSDLCVAGIQFVGREIDSAKKTEPARRY
jgi:CheY-like chemotaxis protein